ncbi:UNVERIFIED_CONTAM: Transportin MOS14 [Sesamum calycinum]|uniref:Transportin MOS14 n=1 Tax=Sesamum calycinum TaxID=2727403 RepID=A0AAW2PMS5_9LAMI
MELQNTVKEALNALYHHPDDAVRMQADRWLQDFQRTIDAWQGLECCLRWFRLCFELDENGVGDFLFQSIWESIGIQLRVIGKVYSIFLLLDEERDRFYAVADNLLHDTASNIETLIFCSQTLRSKVQRDFEELPSEAFRPLRVSLNTLLKSFHKGPPKVRTQEVFNYKIAVRPDRRRSFENELASGMEIALNVLTACLNINELTEQVLEAFASWLRLRHRIPASALASHPLVLTALSSLNSDILSEASVNVISELIHYTAVRNSNAVAQMPLIQVIVPRIMSLKPQLRDPSKDEEDVKAIARLFADMGDAYVELIATGSDESMLIVQALLEVASHPEFDIASMTFNFWHNLQIMLIERDSYVAYGSEVSVEAERARRLQVFRSSYEALVSLVSVKVEYPQDYADLSREDQKDFKQTRYAVADVLIDAALVLGGDAALRILYMKLIEAVSNCGQSQHTDWRPAEAALYSIRAISDFVSNTEGEVMPQIMSLLPKLPHQPQLLQTACLIIGAYSKWLDAAPSGLSFLPPLIDILVSGMSISEETASAAALAFRHICDDCKKKLCGSLDGLFQIYQRAVIGEGSFKVSAEDSLHLVEALSMVITLLPSEHAKKALEALCLPAVAPLQDIINQGPLVLGQKPARDLTVHIDRLANIFRHVNHPEAVADAVQRLWPIFKAIFDIRLGTCGPWNLFVERAKMLTSLRDLTCGLFDDWHHRTAQKNAVVMFMSPVPDILNVVCNLSTCMEFLYSMKGEEFCDVSIDETGGAGGEMAQLSGRSGCSSWKKVNVGKQWEASNSILNFLSDVFDLANSSQGKPYVSIRDNVIIPRGSVITRILVAALAGALPSSRLETVTYALLALTRAYGAKALEWAKASVSLIPSNAVTEVERSRFLQALSDAAAGAAINGLMIPIEELSEVCRRNRSVQEIVQGALRPLELNMAPVS